MTHPTRPRLGAGLALALLVAACGATATPSTPTTSSPGTGATPPVAADPTPVPGGSGDPGGLVPGGGTGGSGDSSGGGVSGGGATGGGSQPGNPGAGDGTLTSPPGPGGGGVWNPQPTIVTPGTGLTGIHKVGAAKLEPAVNGRDVAVRISWWSGVAPCSVLAGVGVVRDGSTFTLTVTEGSDGTGVACIEIAMYKATVVDLGKLDPGTYTITAFGDASPVEVTVAG